MPRLRPSLSLTVFLQLLLAPCTCEEVELCPIAEVGKPFSIRCNISHSEFVRWSFNATDVTCPSNTTPCCPLPCKHHADISIYNTGTAASLFSELTFHSVTTKHNNSIISCGLRNSSHVIIKNVTSCKMAVYQRGRVNCSAKHASSEVVGLECKSEGFFPGIRCVYNETTDGVITESEGPMSYTYSDKQHTCEKNVTVKWPGNLSYRFKILPPYTGENLKEFEEIIIPDRNEIRIEYKSRVKVTQDTVSVCPGMRNVAVLTCTLKWSKSTPTFQFWVANELLTDNVSLHNTSFQQYYVFNSTYTVPVNTSHNRTMLKCEAKVKNVSYGDSKQLTLNWPPAHEPVFKTNESELGDFLEMSDTDLVSIVCSVDGGSPNVASTSVRCRKSEILVLEQTSESHAINFTLVLNNSIDIITCVCRATHVTGCYNRTRTVVVYKKRSVLSKVWIPEVKLTYVILGFLPVILVTVVIATVVFVCKHTDGLYGSTYYFYRRQSSRTYSNTSRGRAAPPLPPPRIPPRPAMLVKYSRDPEDASAEASLIQTRRYEGSLIPTRRCEGSFTPPRGYEGSSSEQQGYNALGQVTVFDEMDDSCSHPCRYAPACVSTQPITNNNRDYRPTPSCPTEGGYLVPQISVPPRPAEGQLGPPAAQSPLPAAMPPLPAAMPPLPAAMPPLPAAMPPLPAAMPPLPAAMPPLPVENDYLVPDITRPPPLPPRSVSLNSDEQSETVLYPSANPPTTVNFPPRGSPTRHPKDETPAKVRYTDETLPRQTVSETVFRQHRADVIPPARCCHDETPPDLPPRRVQDKCVPIHSTTPPSLPTTPPPLPTTPPPIPTTPPPPRTPPPSRTPPPTTPPPIPKTPPPPRNPPPTTPPPPRTPAPHRTPPSSRTPLPTNPPPQTLRPPLYDRSAPQQTTPLPTPQVLKCPPLDTED